MHTIEFLIQAGALFVINHSGGKDSQAMTIKLQAMVPASQLVIVHSHLPGVEWQGVKEHIEATAMGIPVHYVQAGKTFLGMVEARGMFPDKQRRQCTSDLKRGPIEKFINNYARQHGFQLVVNCQGIRAQESSDRAKRAAFEFNPRRSCRHREEYTWLPIHEMLITEVWQTIAAAGQQPHWAYSKGMSRLSCVFCIMSSHSDIRIAAALNPQLAEQYMQLEDKLGHTLLMPGKGGKQMWLRDIIFIELPVINPQIK